MSRIVHRDRTLPILGAVLLAVIVFGPLLPKWALFLLTIAIAKGLVSLGLMLQLRAGLVSFGQALYYCIGGYTAGSIGRFFDISDMLLQMICGASAAAFVALILGFLLARYRGIFYGLLSMALSMILYGLLAKSESLGSTDGINILPSTVFGIRPTQEWLRYVVLVTGCSVAVFATALVQRYLKTPLGQLSPAIKDNEIRVEYMGASVRKAIHIKYVIAAAISGIGGALAATAVGHIDPDMAYWTTSGEFIFITILAGTRSVAAPFLGAIIFETIRTVAFDISPNTWQMTLGIALLLVIVFLPEGLWSLFGRRKAA